MFALIYKRTIHDIVVLDHGTLFDCRQYLKKLESEFAKNCEIVPAWYNEETKEVEF